MKNRLLMGLGFVVLVCAALGAIGCSNSDRTLSSSEASYDGSVLGGDITTFEDNVDHEIAAGTEITYSADDSDADVTLGSGDADDPADDGDTQKEDGIVVDAPTELDYVDVQGNNG
ncbi:MAG: hypothetical protein KKA42_11410 [candidate division Zixibacteria bacterium]|nr:hypothetical protein [candidate division Zixibacteria bacterium]